MLLVKKGRDLKICDFGTARDVTLHSMTYPIGTIQWMAPQVILDKYYNEKCDVYSWAIILWEVLARKIPYSTFHSLEAILYAVPNRSRPPLLQNCPFQIESIMTMSWANQPNERPSISEIEKEISNVFEFCGKQYLESVI